MGLMAWVRKILDTGEITQENVDPGKLLELCADAYIRELAFWTCTNLLANAVSKCEFRTYHHGIEVKDKEYYLWNVEPNRNQNSSTFIQQWISKLCTDNECLIIEHDGQLLVADSFSHTEYALYDDKFEGVSIKDFQLQKTFYQSEVLYFKRSYRDMMPVINGIYNAWERLINYTTNAYQQSRGTRGILKISGTAQKNANFNENLDNIKANFKKFFESSNAVMALFDGFTFDPLNGKTYSNESTRDIRAMADDISDFTAKAFGISPALVRGNVEGTKDALQHTLTFAVDPLCDMLGEEINRKRSGEKGFLSGTYIQIDTKAIEHIDLLRVAPQIDKLIGSGLCSVNDLLRLVGEARINESWADQHFVTKNYDTVERALTALQETQSEI